MTSRMICQKVGWKVRMSEVGGREKTRGMLTGERQGRMVGQIGGAEG